MVRHRMDQTVARMTMAALVCRRAKRKERKLMNIVSAGGVRWLTRWRFISTTITVTLDRLTVSLQRWKQKGYISQERSVY
ncbi:hypothetical protein HA466_0224220 [Hirschfeldia incana]|nr:hypothetical protein HA466_0224220 [Hirschfeldia incana]